MYFVQPQDRQRKILIQVFLTRFFLNLYKTFRFEWEVAKKIILKVVKSITGINYSLLSGEVIRDTNRILNKISEIAVKIEDINVGVEVIQGYFS